MGVVSILDAAMSVIVFVDDDTVPGRETSDGQERDAATVKPWTHGGLRSFPGKSDDSDFIAMPPRHPASPPSPASRAPLSTSEPPKSAKMLN